MFDIPRVRSITVHNTTGHEIRVSVGSSRVLFATPPPAGPASAGVVAFPAGGRSADPVLPNEQAIAPQGRGEFHVPSEKLLPRFYLCVRDATRFHKMDVPGSVETDSQIAVVSLGGTLEIVKLRGASEIVPLALGGTGALHPALDPAPARGGCGAALAVTCAE
jgi:hypothetical protein